MAKITLSYPDTGLTISISVKNRDTGVEVFTGAMTEVGTTKVYTYDFTEVVNTDYVYVATVTGYSDMSGIVYSDEYVGNIWNAQIQDYASTLGSFGYKFAQYGGVSHVIERNSFDEVSKKELEDLRNSFKKTAEDIQKSIANIKPPQIVSEGKTTVIKYDDKSQRFMEDFITDTIPELADKIDNLIPLLKTYEELIMDFEQKERDYEKLIEELINNK